jgi:flagellar basal body-associated protein FliL
MLIMNLWIFTLSIILLWWLFIVAKIHAYKFKNFSNHIIIITQILTIFLIILTIVWYSIILFTTSNTTNVKNYNSFDVDEVNY